LVVHPTGASRRQQNFNATKIFIVIIILCYLCVLVYKPFTWPSSPILGWRLWTRCSCRPSDVATFVVPWTNTRLGDRAFPAAGPQLWNSLPSNLRQSDLTLHQFRRALKTCLFGWLRLQHLLTFVF